MFLLAAMSSIPTDDSDISNDDLNDVINISEEEMGQGDDYILSALAELEDADMDDIDVQQDSGEDGSNFLLESIDEDDPDDDDAFVMEDDGEDESIPSPGKKAKAQPLKDSDALRKELRESIYEKLSSEYEGRLKDSAERIRDLDNDLRLARSHADEKVKEGKEFQDKWVRVSADYQNFQKRSKTKLGEFVELERIKILKEVVPVFENLKRSLEYTGEIEGLVEGVKLIYKQFNDLLDSLGVKEIDADGKPFDPNYHEALHRIENLDLPNNTIIEVLSMGFTSNDRILKPTKVVVSFNPIEKMGSSNGTSDDDSGENGDSAHESDSLPQVDDEELKDSGVVEQDSEKSEEFIESETAEEISGGETSENSVHLTGSTQGIDKEIYLDNESDDENTDAAEIKAT